MAFNLSMNASDIDKTLVESRQLLDSEPATKQYVDEKATWENLQGKPTIFEGGDTLTWDGDTTGRVNAGGVFYKVSDALPTLEDFANGATLDIHGVGEHQLTAEMFGSPFDGVIAHMEFIVLVVSEEAVGVELDGLVFSESGTYFSAGEGFYLKSLTIPGYTGFGKEVIDPDVLPESVKGGSDETVYVTITQNEDNTCSTDMTATQIIPLIEAGKKVKAKLVSDLSAFNMGTMVSFYDLSSYISDPSAPTKGKVVFSSIFNFIDVYWRTFEIGTEGENTSVTFLQGYLSDPNAS